MPPTSGSCWATPQCHSAPTAGLFFSFRPSSGISLASQALCTCLSLRTLAEPHKLADSQHREFVQRRAKDASIAGIVPCRIGRVGSIPVVAFHKRCRPLLRKPHQVPRPVLPAPSSLYLTASVTAHQPTKTQPLPRFYPSSSFFFAWHCSACSAPRLRLYQLLYTYKPTRSPLPTLLFSLIPLSSHLLFPSSFAFVLLKGSSTCLWFIEIPAGFYFVCHLTPHLPSAPRRRLRLTAPPSPALHLTHTPRSLTLSTWQSLTISHPQT